MNFIKLTAQNGLPTYITPALATGEIAARDGGSRISLKTSAHPTVAAFGKLDVLEAPDQARAAIESPTFPVPNSLRLYSATGGRNHDTPSSSVHFVRVLTRDPQSYAVHMSNGTVFEADKISDKQKINAVLHRVSTSAPASP